tara:strand:+ start:307 stop:459 length:153 start_codon:yes stop_codon:yes gene_type:complete
MEAIDEGIVKSITPVKVREGTCAFELNENNVINAAKNEEYKIFICFFLLV